MFVCTNTFRRPSRNASRKRPVPADASGSLHRGGVDAHDLDARLARRLRARPARPRSSSARSPTGTSRGGASPRGPRCRSPLRSWPPRTCAPGAAPLRAAAARTTTGGPSTFARSIGAGSATQSEFTPATWNTSEAPSIARARASSSKHVAAHGRGADRRQLGVGLGRARQRHDLVAATCEALHQRPPDDTAAAGDEDATHVSERSAEEKRRKYSTPDQTVITAAITISHWSR